MSQLTLVTPILRSFDEAKAREFYLAFLGFRVLFEHRFEARMPLYLGIARDAVELHLSEHPGDASAGASLRIAVADIDALQAELAAKAYQHARPQVETMPWGTRDMKLTDPFGNRLTFTHAISL